jgi:hypothetical protein
MNTIANTIQCINGLCGHAEHTINLLWWLAPAVLMIAYITKKLHGKT